jgi:hypothetical protein
MGAKLKIVIGLIFFAYVFLILNLMLLVPEIDRNPIFQLFFGINTAY